MPRSTESLFAEMQRYVAWNAGDSAQLAILGEIARPHFREIAEAFYERTRAHEHAHDVFRDEAQIERLKGSMVRWLESLCSGPHDESYFAERANIGRVHVRVGLRQHYMFTSMALIREALHVHAERTPEPAKVHRALDLMLDLELAIMLETYRQDSEARIQRVERLERQEMERALARNEHRYVSAVEFAQSMVIGLDADLRIVLWNREAERVTGRARDEVLGANLVDTIFPEDLQAEARARLQGLVRGESGTWLGALVDRAGRRRHSELALSYVPDGQGDALVAFVTGRDETDELAREERTLRTEKLAAVGTLAAGLAHEIRNPLNGALLHVTFLERAFAKRGETSDVLDAVKLVGGEIRRLSALVKDFLVFARPASPELRPTVLNEVLLRVATVVAPEAASSCIELVPDLGGSTLTVSADAAKLEQAVLNLIRNAIDAVAAGEGSKIVLRLRRKPRQAVLEVEDDGPGLPSVDAPIFDAFYSTKPQGTGLGLSIVHRIVSDHNGTIDVESKPGRTVFRIVLPLVESE
jgi:PAS domain S-box-containing protein